MIREKYDQDAELVDLEREILTGEDEGKKDAALGSLAVRGGGAQPPSRLGNAAAGKMVPVTAPLSIWRISSSTFSGVGYLALDFHRHCSYVGFT